MSGTPDWLVLAWRLPAGLSTPRVTTWRNLQRLGAARLTPGAAVVPFREDLQEQLDWLAQDIETQGGEAWVLPVTGLSESEERTVRERMAADRNEEYRALEEDALAFIARRSVGPAPAHAFAARLQIDKELLALQRRFRKIRARDYVDAPARAAAALAVDRCLAFRQGISPKVLAVTDAQVAAQQKEEDDI
jgi:ChrB-like protein